MALRSALLLLSLLCSAVLAASAADAPNLPLVNVTYSADGRTGAFCKQPPNALPSWRLNRSRKGPWYSCLKHPTQDGYWSMLNAYRSGGTAGKHWGHTRNHNAPQCLQDWTYYGKDGVWIVEQVKGRLTRKGDAGDNWWCAFPVAQVKKKTTTEPAGVEGKQWAFCTCTDKPPTSETRGDDTSDDGAYVPGLVYVEPQ